MRPSHLLLLVFAFLTMAASGLLLDARARQHRFSGQLPDLDATCAALGLSDLCLATEARYTRHPAVSDGLVPFMDHPGGLEHFPSGSFWYPGWTAAAEGGRL